MGITSFIKGITNRMRAEEALTEKQKFQTLSESAPFGMVMIDKDGAFRYINPKFRELFGYDLNDVPDGKTWFRKAYPDPTYRHHVISTWINDSETFKPGEKRPRTFTVTCKDGMEKIINFISVQLETGEYLMTFEDITDRVRFEESIRESEEKYRNLVERANDGIAIIQDGILQYINLRLAKIINYTIDEVIGTSFFDHLDPEEVPKVADRYKRRMAGEDVIPIYETILRRKDGSRIDVELNAGIITYQGRPADLMILRDVSERKRAEEALRESEKRYRALFEGSRDAIYITSRDGEMLDVNESMLDLFGYSREEMIGLNAQEAYAHPEDRLKFQREIERNGFVRDYEIKLRKKDGTEMECLLTSTVRRANDGSILGYQGIIRDITERKRADQEKAALQEQLRQSQKMEAIGQLAGGIAHDFNNLLTIIKGYSQFCLTELKKDDPLKESIEEIKIASDRAADLIHQLLAFSRRQVLDMRVLNLNTILINLDKMLRRVIGEDIELVTLLANDLGGVKIDPGQIELVIMNLVVNARDAMPNGGKLTIETANAKLDEAYARTHLAVTPGPYVVLSVSDTGVGMTPEVKERVFEPFFTTKQEGKGSGLGLSTVYGIVKQSGGNIWVYSEPGKGTTFKIYLPRVDEPLEELKERVVGEGFPRGSETVLVVEDDDEVRKLAVRILEKQGYRVLEASHGGDALIICEQHEGPIHLILTDVVMPGMSGRALAERLTPLHPEMKVLYMSGYTDNTIVHHGVLEERMSYIQKPFSIDGLTKKVREVLDKDSKPAV